MFGFNTRTFFKSAFKVLAGFITISSCFTFGTSSEQRSLTKEEIWTSTNEDNAFETIGLGGRYGTLSKNFISKLNIIECDHFPPKSSYRHSPNNDVSQLSENAMACVSLRYGFHRKFYTTGNNPQSLKPFADFFEKENYYDAIAFNIQLYINNPDRTTGKDRDGALGLLREGIRQGLTVHVQNGLIDDAERNELINRFNLKNDYPMNLITILNSHRRDSARKYLP